MLKLAGVPGAACVRYRMDSWASSIALFIPCCHWSSHCFLLCSSIFFLHCSSSFCLYAENYFPCFTVVLALPSNCSWSLRSEHSFKNSPLSHAVLAHGFKKWLQNFPSTTVLFVLVSKASEARSGTADTNRQNGVWLCHIQRQALIHE